MGTIRIEKVIASQPDAVSYLIRQFPGECGFAGAAESRNPDDCPTNAPLEGVDVFGNLLDVHAAEHI